MPRTYPVEVRLFVVNKKREGHSWDRVAELVKQEFNIESPGRRQMSKWVKTIDRSTINQALEQTATKELEAKKGQAIAMAMDDLLPRLWKARDAGEDIEYRGWSWFFGIQENVLGSKKFWQYLDKYRIERSGQTEYPPTPSPWGQESLGTQSEQK